MAKQTLTAYTDDDIQRIIQERSINDPSEQALFRDRVYRERTNFPSRQANLQILGQLPDIPPQTIVGIVEEINILSNKSFEIDLNVSPIPKTNELSFSESPHLVYREIPINVLTSWGDPLNFGYTRVDIDINLDLRKWTTYFLPPIVVVC